MNDNKLQGEYKEAFTNVVIYLASSNVPGEFIEEVRDDIEDLLLNAQEDKRNIKEIIGDDIESFCKEIIGSKKFKNHNLTVILTSIKFGMFFSMIAAIAYKIFNFDMTLNVIIAYIFDAILCSFVYTKMIRKVIVKIEGMTKKIINLSLITILFMVPAMIVNYLMLTNLVIYINSTYTPIVLLIIICCIFILEKKLKK